MRTNPSLAKFLPKKKRIQVRISKKEKMKLSILSLLFVLLSTSFAVGQSLPTDKKTGEIVYTDVILFDTLTASKAYTKMLDFVKGNPTKNSNIQSNEKQKLITFTTINNASPQYPNEIGYLKSDVVLTFLSNEFSYRIANFSHIPMDMTTPCANNLNAKKPTCFGDKSPKKYWKQVKSGTAKAMNDYIMKLIFVTLEDQPTTETLRINEYFLARNWK